MFEGYSSDTHKHILPPVSMGARAEGIKCPDPGARIPIGARLGRQKLSLRKILQGVVVRIQVVIC